MNGNEKPVKVTAGAKKASRFTNLIHKAEDKIISMHDKREMKRDNKIPANNNAINNVNPAPANVNQAQIARSVKPRTPNKPLKKYRYVVMNAMNKKESGTFEAENENEVRNFLMSQDYKVISVKPRASYDIEINDYPKMKAKDLAFSLTQLSTYIKSGIPLVDSVKILEKQSTKQSNKKAFRRLVYELLNGESLSNAMAKQHRVFPPLLINMVKTAELTGDLPTILDDMADYYTSIDKTKKQMISAMTYPIVILTVAFGVLVFMLTYLVPQFATLFEQNNAKLPGITLFVLGVSGFVQKYYILLLIIISAFIITFVCLYKNVPVFKKGVQVVLMHIPIIKNLIIYNEVAVFTKTFASLLNHGVFITDSMEVLSKVTNNEVYKQIINNSLTNLGKGDSISESFRGQWAFPVVAYEMLVTGENTGQLGLMMEKVADHFQSLHKTLVDQFKSLMEPAMIIALATIVGVILLSIVVPMFSIYGQIK